MTDPTELRLRCAGLAVRAGAAPGDVVAVASDLLKFATSAASHTPPGDTRDMSQGLPAE